MRDNGKMAAVFAPLAEVERILKTIDGYVVIANINSDKQAVIGGASQAVEQAMEVFRKAGYNVVPLPVSHAFHTSIVAPASEPLREMLERLHLQSPPIPIVANVNGEFYPTGPDVVPQMLDLLAQQVASSRAVRQGTAHALRCGRARLRRSRSEESAAGICRGRARRAWRRGLAVHQSSEGGRRLSFNQALCGLYAAGLGLRNCAVRETRQWSPVEAAVARVSDQPRGCPYSGYQSSPPMNGDRYVELGRLFADVLERGWDIYHGQKAPRQHNRGHHRRGDGTAGTEHIFDDGNVARILRGDQFIKPIPAEFRRDMLDKRITRLVKSENGEATFDTIEDRRRRDQAWRARGGAFDLEKEFGVSPSAWLRSIASPAWPSRSASTPCVMQAFLWSCATRPPAKARSCPTGGDCPTRCATTPA